MSCQCGCGEELSPFDSRGRPRRFRVGHSRRFRAAYYKVRGGKVEHVAVAEKALGKPLPSGSVVHHADGNVMNNVPSNLVICQDRAYHNLLHRRTRIVRAGGNPNTQRFCATCKRLTQMSDMAKSRNRPFGIGNECKQCQRLRWSVGNAVAIRSGLYGLAR